MKIYNVTEAWYTYNKRFKSGHVGLKIPSLSQGKGASLYTANI